MRRRLFYIITDIILIAFAAVLGTFIWNHGRVVFNAYNHLEALRVDITTYWQAYIAVAIIALVIVVILYYRAKADKELLTKADIERNTRILILIAKKLGVTESEIEAEMQNQSKQIKRKVKSKRKMR